jgi:hypothetical protein
MARKVASQLFLDIFAEGVNGMCGGIGQGSSAREGIALLAAETDGPFPRPPIPPQEERKHSANGDNCGCDAARQQVGVLDQDRRSADAFWPLLGRAFDYMGLKSGSERFKMEEATHRSHQ